MRKPVGQLERRLPRRCLAGHGVCAAPRGRARGGISLLEVLISMFVLLFGLMGVAAMFPVGNHYAAQGQRFDRAAAAAPAAFAELKTRGYLRPEKWLYAPLPPTLAGQVRISDPQNQIYPVMLTGHHGPNYTGEFNLPYPAAINQPHPGFAYVLDPLGVAAVVNPNPADANAAYFPGSMFDTSGSVTHEGYPNVANPWNSGGLAGQEWPIRRITIGQFVPSALSRPMPRTIAETTVTIRDELSVAVPKNGDLPGQQLWKLADPNGTEKDFSDDLPLARQYSGNYSWLATIAPANTASVVALQPGHSDYGLLAYEVSVALFSRRDEVPSPQSERAIAAEMTIGGELVAYSPGYSNDDLDAVNNALKDIRAGQWIAVAGVHATTGNFLLKWYRILSLQDEISDTTDDQITLSNGSRVLGRRLMLDGPEWPVNSMTNLRAILLPGVFGVTTQALKMETDSAWTVE
ncbi:MAG: hypothetical protein KF688_04785 [Pirellulales bacterium]|nr:hypothetical protein [Pirellulales bacterium]